MGEVFKEFLNLFRGDEKPILKIMRFGLVLTIILALVVALESAMGLVTIGRLERQVNLLKELNALAETGLGSHNQLVHLENIFSRAVGDLENYNPNLLQMVQSTLPASSQVTWLEIVAGASSWILVGILTLRTAKGGAVQKLMGCAMLTGIGFAVAYVIAHLITTSNSLLAIPLSCIFGTVTLVLIVVVASAVSPRKQSQAKESEQPVIPKT